MAAPQSPREWLDRLLERPPQLLRPRPGVTAVACDEIDVRDTLAVGGIGLVAELTELKARVARLERGRG